MGRGENRVGKGGGGGGDCSTASNTDTGRKGINPGDVKHFKESTLGTPGEARRHSSLGNVVTILSPKN